MAVSIRNTKAEILEAYSTLAAHQTNLGDVTGYVTRTSQTVAEEVVLLVKDCYKLGCWARKQYDGLKAELSRPLLKS